MAEWIEHKNITHMMNIVDDEEKLKRTLYVSGQNREMWFLTEDGLYEVYYKYKSSSIKKKILLLLFINIFSMTN